MGVNSRKFSLAIKSNLDVRVAAQPLFQMQRGVGAAKTAAENQNPFLRCRGIFHSL
jgi:hypothetical protein